MIVPSSCTDRLLALPGAGCQRIPADGCADPLGASGTGDEGEQALSSQNALPRKCQPDWPKCCHWNTHMEDQWVARGGGRTLRREHTHVGLLPRPNLGPYLPWGLGLTPKRVGSASRTTRGSAC